MTTAATGQRPVEQLLRHWRQRRRLSQLEFSIRADISTRHLSFVETGRAQPSRDMLPRLAEELDLPLRDRNRLLLAAGYAPVHTERPLESTRDGGGAYGGRPDPVGTRAVSRRGRGPRLNLVDGNASVAMFTAGAAPELLEPPIHVLWMALHPEGLAGRIVNLGEFRAHLLGRLRRQVDVSGDGISRTCTTSSPATPAVGPTRTSQRRQPVN